MLQCKHVSCGKYASNKCEQARVSFEVIYRIYTKFAFHSSHNEKQINALYNQSTLLFESLPETRCSVNAIHTNACTEHLIPQMETGSDEAQKSPKHKVQGTTKPRPTWTIWESEKESRHQAAQIELEGEQTKDHATRVVDVQMKANEMVEVGVRAIC